MIRSAVAFALIFGIFLLSGCGGGYLPGFNFRSFDQTPVEELSDAVEANDAEAIEEFLKTNRVLIDYQDEKWGHSILFLAVVNDRYEAAKTLLENGANLLIRDYSDSSDVLMTFCKGYGQNECDTAMLQLLLAHHPDLHTYDINDRGEKVPLLLRASDSMFRCKRIIEMLVNAGADVNDYSREEPGWSPICTALLLERLDIARYYIIDCNADIPDTLFLRPHTDTHKIPVSITMLLNEHDYSKQAQQQRLKQEIIDYLQSQGKE